FEPDLLWTGVTDHRIRIRPQAPIGIDQRRHAFRRCYRLPAIACPLARQREMDAQIEARMTPAVARDLREPETRRHHAPRGQAAGLEGFEGRFVDAMPQAEIVTMENQPTPIGSGTTHARSVSPDARRRRATAYRESCRARSSRSRAP